MFEPFFRHPLISQRPKLQTYSRRVQAILWHGAESQTFSPAQVTRIDSLYFKALRQIWHVKIPCYHHVINPFDQDCSNDYLLSLSYPTLPAVIPNSIRISDLRMKYLSLFEYSLLLNPAGTLRTLFSSFRRGAARAHWSELSLAEAQLKVSTRQQSTPNRTILPTILYSFHNCKLKSLTGNIHAKLS